jgi:hypothetical protein
VDISCYQQKQATNTEVSYKVRD